MLNNSGQAGPPTPEQVLAVLSAIQDPDLGRDVVSLGMIKNLVVSPDGRVGFTFELTTPACPVRDRFQTMASKLVADLPGVTAVDLKMTANVRSAFKGRQVNQVIPGVRQAIAIASGVSGALSSAKRVLVRSSAKSGAKSKTGCFAVR